MPADAPQTEAAVARPQAAAATASLTPAHHRRKRSLRRPKTGGDRRLCSLAPAEARRGAPRPQ